MLNTVKVIKWFRVNKVYGSFRVTPGWIILMIVIRT